MIPLRVTAQLRGPVESMFGRVALDAMLVAAVCMRDGLPPAILPEDVLPVAIPVALSPCQRFYLASFSIGDVEERERLTTYKRFPGAEAMLIGPASLKRMPITTGAGKSYVMPHELRHMVGDRLTWYCLGDADAIRGLLELIHYVGKNRKVGHGAVARWFVEPCEAWDEGFPVARDGKPLRPLPPDFPGLRDPSVGPMALKPPYDQRRNPNRTLCAMPR